MHRKYMHLLGGKPPKGASGGEVTLGFLLNNTKINNYHGKVFGMRPACPPAGRFGFSAVGLAGCVCVCVCGFGGQGGRLYGSRWLPLGATRTSEMAVLIRPDDFWLLESPSKLHGELSENHAKSVYGNDG